MKHIHRIVALCIIGMALGAWLAGDISAIAPKTLEDFGAQRLYSARSSAVSSHTVSGYLLSWSLTAIGGAVDFEVKHTTSTGSDGNVNTSSTIYALQGQVISDTAGALVNNPILLITRIDAATTAYIDISYLAPRDRGNY